MTDTERAIELQRTLGVAPPESDLEREILVEFIRSLREELVKATLACAAEECEQLFWHVGINGEAACARNIRALAPASVLRWQADHAGQASQKGSKTNDREIRNAEHDAALIAATLDFASRHDFFETQCGCRVEWDKRTPPREQWREHVRSLGRAVAAWQAAHERKG